MRNSSKTTQHGPPGGAVSGVSVPDAAGADAAKDTELLERLSQRLHACSPLALAFSGGLDSRFLAHTAARLAQEGVQARLFHIRGPHVQWAESAEALTWARARGFGITLVSLNPLTVPEVRANSKLRCYHCKRFLFTTLLEAVSAHPAFAGQKPILCDGSNHSDLDALRPGLRALEELGVRSPLAEAGLSKEDIRRLAARTGLDRPDQHARPCLLTRFAYGLMPTPEVLAALEAAENSLDRLLAAHAPHVPEFRLRLVAGPDLASSGHFAASGSFPLSAYRTELHLGVELPEALNQRLAHAVTQEGLAAPRLLVLARVSGHYDR